MNRALTKPEIRFIIVDTMYIDTAYSKQREKIYCRHLLRESFRENGKVKHRTLANLSHCRDEEIAALKLALKHNENLTQLISIDEIGLKQGVRIGAVFCLNKIAEEVGLAGARVTIEREGSPYGRYWQGALTRALD